jgi:hypothetical protein
MDSGCRQFLAGAPFSDEQDWTSDGRDFGDGLLELEKNIRLAKGFNQIRRG